MPPNRSRQPETPRNRKTTDVHPFSRFPIQKLKHDTDNRKNYLKNKLEAQLEIQRRESYAAQPGKHSPSDETICCQNPSTTKDALQSAGRTPNVDQRQRLIAFHMLIITLP